MWITWKHEDSDLDKPLAFAQKVELFYEATLGWQLHIADLVANGGTTFGEFKQDAQGYDVRTIRHSGFAVLHICFSYIELVGSLSAGKPQAPTKAFVAGVRAIPNLIDTTVSTRAVTRLYNLARCGLYHEGRTRRGVGLGQSPDGKVMAYGRADRIFLISPERLPVVLKVHLACLRDQLLDPANTALRGRFEQRFDAGFA